MLKARRAIQRDSDKPAEQYKIVSNQAVPCHPWLPLSVPFLDPDYGIIPLAAEVDTYTADSRATIYEFQSNSRSIPDEGTHSLQLTKKHPIWHTWTYFTFAVSFSELWKAILENMLVDM